jgi:hypothetical protein
MPALLKKGLGKTGANDSDSQLAVNSYCELFAVVFVMVFLFGFVHKNPHLFGDACV